MKRLILLAFSLLLYAWGSTASAATPVSVGLRDVIAAVEKSFQPDGTGRLPISDFTADFFQSTRLAKQQRELRGDGRLSVRMPSGNLPLMFHFEYYRPSRQEIVSDGRSMWIYHPENREVILSDVSFLFDRHTPDPSRDPAVNLLQGLGRISQDFQINFAPGMYDAAGNYVLELTPRRSMLTIRRLLMVVNRINAINAASARKTPGSPSPAPSFVPSRPVPMAQTPFANTPFGPGQSDPFPILSTTVDDHNGNTITMEFANIRINSNLPISQFNFLVPGDVQVIRPSEGNLPK